jgi:ATP-dependent DNA helicase RecG
MVGITTLTEKPSIGRKIVTSTVPMNQIDSVIANLKQNIPHGTKVFWITPCVHPTALLQNSSVIERYNMLHELFPGRVGLIYGTMTSDEKENVMNQFFNNEISILVATTVVEVGIDIPDASMCVIERAEYFGLSQLHQIRGRIGRGKAPINEKIQDCQCILLYKEDNNISTSKDSVANGVDNIANIDDDDDDDDDDNNTCVDMVINSDPLLRDAHKRLEVMVNCNDGFEIAEYDLSLRGPGDLFGFRQHGETKTRLVAMYYIFQVIVINILLYF